MKLRKSNGVCYNTILILCWPIFKLLYRFHVEGEENIPDNEKCIICPNHTSNADPVLLVLSKGRKIYFMAKAELFKNKLMSSLFHYFGAFPVNRGKSDRSALDKAAKVLQENQPLAIFLEGTRSKTGEFLKPKSGAVLIAFNTNTPIIPVCISPENGGRVRLFKKVTVKIGEPINTSSLGIKGESLKEFRYASGLVMDKIKSLKDGK